MFQLDRVAGIGQEIDSDILKVSESRFLDKPIRRVSGN